MNDKMLLLIHLRGYMYFALQFPVGVNYLQIFYQLAHLASLKSCNSHMFYTDFNLTLFPCFSVHIVVYQHWLWYNPLARKWNTSWLGETENNIYIKGLLNL